MRLLPIPPPPPPPPTFASLIDLMTVLAEVGGTLECFWMTAFMAIALTMQFQDSWLLLTVLVGVRWFDSRTASAIQRLSYGQNVGCVCTYIAVPSV